MSSISSLRAVLDVSQEVRERARQREEWIRDTANQVCITERLRETAKYVMSHLTNVEDEVILRFTRIIAKAVPGMEFLALPFTTSMQAISVSDLKLLRDRILDHGEGQVELVNLNVTEKNLWQSIYFQFIEILKNIHELHLAINRKKKEDTLTEVALKHLIKSSGKGSSFKPKKEKINKEVYEQNLVQYYGIEDEVRAICNSKLPKIGLDGLVKGVARGIDKSLVEAFNKQKIMLTRDQVGDLFEKLISIRTKIIFRKSPGDTATRTLQARFRKNKKERREREIASEMARREELERLLLEKDKTDLKISEKEDALRATLEDISQVDRIIEILRVKLKVNKNLVNECRLNLETNQMKKLKCKDILWIIFTLGFVCIHWKNKEQKMAANILTASNVITDSTKKIDELHKKKQKWVVIQEKLASELAELGQEMY